MKIKVYDKTRHLGQGDFEFAPEYVFRFDQNCDDYDWLVVFDDIVGQDSISIKCPRANTILCTWEPISVKTYSRGFTRQFAHYLTNRPFSAEKHNGYFFGRGYFPWLIDRSYSEVLTKCDFPKSRLVSVVCSRKRMKHTAHHHRFRLLEHLCETLPQLDWYGHIFNPIDKKYKALDDYRYHLAIENHIASGHWSEKIVDPLLCECLPFYAGDPELGNILPPESFIPIPYDNPSEAEHIIKSAIANNEFEKRLPAIREAKKLLLTKYNFWAQVIELINCATSDVGIDFVHNDVIYSRRAYRRHHPLSALDDAWHRLLLNMGLN